MLLSAIASAKVGRAMRSLLERNGLHGRGGETCSTLRSAQQVEQIKEFFS